VLAGRNGEVRPAKHGFRQERLSVMNDHAPAKLKLSIKLGWAIGELGIALFVGVTMMFFLFYLTEAHNISPAWAGIALLVPRLLDAIADPLFGALSDRVRCGMGRRRPFVLVGSILYGLGVYLFLAMPDFETETAKIVYAIATYIFASFAYSIISVPYSAMAAEMTTDYRERTDLIGYKMVAARLGIIGAGTMTPLLYATQETLAEGFRLVGAVFSIFMVVTGLITFFTTRDAPRIERPVQAFSLKEEFRAIIQNRPFSILFIVFLCQNIALGASATLLVYFLTYVMRADASMIGPLIAIGGITATLFTPPWVLASKRLGKRRAYFVALAIVCVMALPALFLPPEMVMLLFAIYLVAAIGDAGHQLMSNSMVPDTVEIDELRTGERREGAIFGAWAFCLKLGMAFGAFLVSLGLQSVGFAQGGGMEAQSTVALLGVRILYALVPFLFWIGAMIALGWYDLSETRFNTVKKQIADRRVAAE